MPTKPTNIDQYLGTVALDKRAALEGLRRTIREAAPLAEECLSYGIPAFRQGRMLVGFGATKKHCALYLMSATVLDGFQDEAAGLDTAKGTIRFQADQPLSSALVHRLVAARLAENAALDAAKRGR